MKTWLIILLFVLVGPIPSFGQEPAEESLLNKLFAPGPLIEGHKDLESKDCLKCHDAGKGLPDDKCLSCHKEIKPFVETKRGLHGRNEKRCHDCHKDHKGREFDSVKIDEKKFNHDITGLSLSGKHAELKCSECHSEKRTKKATRQTETRYLGQTSSCVSCHRKNDIHAFKGTWAKKDCDSCHSTQSWKQNNKFNHDRDTSFKLTERHAELKCQDCHNPKSTATKLTAGIYQWPKLTTEKCLTCHTTPHRETFTNRFQNGNCTSCHSQSSWKIKVFDHRITNYPLRGRHAQIKCLDCHKQEPQRLKQGPAHYAYKGLSKNCLSCHKDQHYFATFKSSRLKTPNNCITCHNEEKWETIHDFNHTTDTRFIIDGKHSSVSCKDCHRPDKKVAKILLSPRLGITPGQYHWSNLDKNTCNTCHANPHLNSPSKAFSQKKCSSCHITESWQAKPSDKKSGFDHNQTRFTLTGKHTDLKCASCHNLNGKQIFKFPTDQAGFCIDCHNNPHLEQLHPQFSGQSCTECHDTKSFKERKPFDHDKSAFTLKGQHKELACLDCHKAESRSLYAKKEVIWHKFLFPELQSKSCTTCHNDFHAGQLGQKCQSCHSENSWKKPEFNHNKNSSFPLLGEHAKAKCQDCHKPHERRTVEFGDKNKQFPVIVYKPINTDCVNCHKNDDVHKGQFGNRCQSCHVERGWGIVKDFHRNFTLHASHFTLSCVECHRQDRKLSGTSESCATCHQKDDIHNGSLPNCNECHRQSFWEHTKFRHSMTSFPLRGSHRALDCFSCHNTGVYQGTSTSCTTCHVGSIDNSNFNHNAILNVQECNKCHNQFSFDLGQ